jgi:NAD-dependent deacetylase
MIEKAAEIINKSKNIVALTGAGISTEAGIPDFRSPESGLWNKVDPMISLSSLGFKLRPKAFYKLGLELIPPFLNAEPTEAHYFLAKLEAIDKLSCVITQNIDGLHQKAGSKKVVEIHGNIRKGHCIKCNREYSLGKIKKKIENKGIPPKCDMCAKPIKPDIVLFGDPLPVEGFEKAKAALSECDILLIIGSSLQVYPVADFPRIALQRGAGMVIINLEQTPYDRDAIVLRGQAGQTCKAISELLK